VPGQDALEKLPSLLGEVDFDETSVLGLAFAADKPAFLKMIHYHGHVTGAHEVLLSKISLRKRPEEVESVENTELSRGNLSVFQKVGSSNLSGRTRYH